MRCVTLFKNNHIAPFCWAKYQNSLFPRCTHSIRSSAPNLAGRFFPSLFSVFYENPVSTALILSSPDLSFQQDNFIRQTPNLSPLGLIAYFMATRLTIPSPPTSPLLNASLPDDDNMHCRDALVAGVYGRKRRAGLVICSLSIFRWVYSTSLTVPLPPPFLFF